MPGESDILKLEKNLAKLEQIFHLLVWCFRPNLIGLRNGIRFRIRLSPVQSPANLCPYFIMLWFHFFPQDIVIRLNRWYSVR